MHFYIQIDREIIKQQSDLKDEERNGKIPLSRKQEFYKSGIYNPSISTPSNLNMANEKLVLSAADYIIFAAMLLISSGIGVFFQMTSKKKTNEEYLLAGKDMSILPVAFSLMATFMSATTLMGIPAEMYLYGTNMAFMNIGFILGPIITSYVFLPIYFANDISTAYEYLEKRFGKRTRKITSTMFAIQTLFFTSATLYAPALALSAVTSLPMWMSVVSVGLVCTLYCTLGGMKAVLWADVFQAVLMFVCVSSVIVQGSLLVGGIDNVFQMAEEGGRLIFPKFSLDLAAHYTIFNIFAQGMIITMSSYAGGQCQVQRLMTLSNLKRSRIAAFISIPMIVSFQLLCCLCGLVLYAYFRNCDPMTSPNKPIYSADQLIPYFIATTLDHLPGIPGLCICGIFSASLSTVSSAINSLASVAIEDFIRPMFPKFTITAFHGKAMSLMFGLICVALSFIVASLGHLVKMSVIICGNLAGPILAVFLLAACTTSANEWGVILGIIASIVLASCLSFIPENKTDPFLPLSNECTSFDYAQPNATFTFVFPSLQNYTSFIYTNTTTRPFNATTADEVKVFHISYMWVSTIAMISCLVVGYLGSLVISFFCGKQEDIPAIYLSPIRIRLPIKDSENETSKRKIKNEVEMKPNSQLNGDHCAMPRIDAKNGNAQHEPSMRF